MPVVFLWQPVGAVAIFAFRSPDTIPRARTTLVLFGAPTDIDRKWGQVMVQFSARPVKAVAPEHPGPYARLYRASAPAAALFAARK